MTWRRLSACSGNSGWRVAYRTRRAVAALQRIHCSFQGTANFNFTFGPACSCYACRGWARFHKQSIFEPGEPQCVNACGFFNGGLAQRNGPSAGALRPSSRDFAGRNAMSNAISRSATDRSPGCPSNFPRMSNIDQRIRSRRLHTPMITAPSSASSGDREFGNAPRRNAGSELCPNLGPFPRPIFAIASGLAAQSATNHACFFRKRKRVRQDSNIAYSTARRAGVYTR
jgi:hypothetical protein